MDPRANSPEKITPPSPLPYVSRRALRRVTGYMPPPEACRYCGDTVSIVSHTILYGREYGDWPYAYLCDNPRCDAYVGLHPDTDLPLGILADKRTREARKVNKAIFIELQQSRDWRRSEAYAWLAQRLGIPVKECHWGWFDADRAELAGAICAEHLEVGA